MYVDNAVDEVSLVRNNKDNDFNNYNPTNRNSFNLKNQAVNGNHVITKSYVDQFHNDNERNRTDLGLDFYNKSGDIVENNQDNDIKGKKLTNLDSITVNTNSS